jgi:hypothetical protein
MKLIKRITANLIQRTKTYRHMKEDLTKICQGRWETIDALRKDKAEQEKYIFEVLSKIATILVNHDPTWFKYSVQIMVDGITAKEAIRDDTGIRNLSNFIGRLAVGALYKAFFLRK